MGRHLIVRWWRAFRFFRRCQACGCRGAQHYHQRTQYADEASNWVSLCRDCTEENDAYWDERWAEYYAGCL